MKILILCTGNSCRSQMAHGFLQSFDGRLYVRSAGTEPAMHINQKAVEVMADLGLDISGHTPHLVDEYLDEDWDYVITVCDHANETCPAFLGKVKHRLHLGFEDPSLAAGTPGFIYGEFIRIRDAIRETFLELYNRNLKEKL
ncbi:arsenate reductase ArsC [bacterium]|nr:arsenate reductase ArsC [bacterium]